MMEYKRLTEKKLRDTDIYKGLFEHFYNAGYRKIPEGAVVLTREEFSEKIENTWLNCQEFTRKETAEKFAERVKMAFYYEFDELIPSIMADKIDEICKEITGGENEDGNKKSG